MSIIGKNSFSTSTPKCCYCVVGPDPFNDAPLPTFPKTFISLECFVKQSFIRSSVQSSNSPGRQKGCAMIRNNSVQGHVTRRSGRQEALSLNWGLHEGKCTSARVGGRTTYSTRRRSHLYTTNIWSSRCFFFLLSD